MAYDIQDRVVLITGANRGIGKVLVETFLDAGIAKVYAAVRNLTSVEPLVQRYGERVVPVHLDLADPGSIVEAARQSADVEVVINNAGVLRTAQVLDPNAIQALQFEADINVYGLIRMAQAFAPVLAANGGGAFVQLNSVVSMKSFASFATYSASKAAAYSITQALREQLRPQGTAVMSVHPGPIATDMGDAAGLTEIAEPPTLVAKGIIDGLRAGDFHVFPDSMARQIGHAYADFAANVVEADISEG